MSLNFITDPVPEYSYEEEMENNTLISRFANRAEQRRTSWSQSYRMFTLKYNIKTREEIDRLWNFYQLCKGAFKTFNFQRPINSLLPYGQATAWWPLHEGEGTKVDDWNGFIYPTFSCRFVEDGLSYEEFSVRLQKTGIKLIQASPISYTNNYGTASGGATWIQCPDGSAGVNFDGANGQMSAGDALALDVGAGDFSFALGIYTNSLASQIGVLSKKADAAAGTAGYHLVIGTNGQITVRLSNGTTLNTIVSAVGAIANQTWKIIAVTFDRDGNGQIYVNNSASGSPVALTAGNADNAQNFYLGRAEGVAYGNFKIRNCLFAKKVWTQAELDKIWNTWRGILGI